MNLFKSSSKQVNSWSRFRHLGRKRFILYFGVLGWGLSTALLTLLWSWHDKFHWSLPPRADIGSVILEVLVRLVIWPTAGYFFGASMWRGAESALEAEKQAQAIRDSPSGRISEDAIPHDPRMGHPGQ
jgi:hypothetical protein